MSEEFPGNSNKQKVEVTQGPKVTRVVQGDVIQRKRPLGKKFMETFFGGSAKDVSSYVFWDVALPGAKDWFFNTFIEGLERSLYGEARGRANRRGPGSAIQTFGNASYQAYNRYSGPSAPAGHREDPRNALSRRARASHDLGQIVVATKAEADGILSQMYDLLETYEVVTLAAFYEMCNIKAMHTDEKYGWTDLSGSRAHRTRGGYVLDIPSPVALD